jgi:hypothetical protein
MFKKLPDLKPDLGAFNLELARVAGTTELDGTDVAKVFRHLFLTADPILGKKVLFILLSWCGEYQVDDPDDSDGRVPPLDPAALQRWAGKREIAALIKAAMYADLSQ